MDGIDMSQTEQERNKALVLEAFDTLFNMGDYKAAERYWSPNYIQHCAHIEPGREGLFNLIRGLPASSKYEAGTIVSDGDFVIVNGRFSGFGAPANWIAADILMDLILCPVGPPRLISCAWRALAHARC
jgi:predicted SnoaL-like aldol condensation-catalyzing enzyme